MSQKVLIAMSQPGDRCSTGSLFDRFGFLVVQAVSGYEAVDIYTLDPTFDVVLVDLSMEGLDGISVARLIRRFQKGKRPFVVGFGDSVEIARKAESFGVDLVCFREGGKPVDNVISFAVKAALRDQDDE